MYNSDIAAAPQFYYNTSSGSDMSAVTNIPCGFQHERFPGLFWVCMWETESKRGVKQGWSGPIFKINMFVQYYE